MIIMNSIFALPSASHYLAEKPSLTASQVQVTSGRLESVGSLEVAQTTVTLDEETQEVEVPATVVAQAITATDTTQYLSPLARLAYGTLGTAQLLTTAAMFGGLGAGAYYLGSAFWSPALAFLTKEAPIQVAIAANAANITLNGPAATAGVTLTTELLAHGAGFEAMQTAITAAAVTTTLTHPYIATSTAVTTGFATPNFYKVGKALWQPVRVVGRFSSWWCSSTKDNIAKAVTGRSS